MWGRIKNINDIIKTNKLIFDGYPRTINQAKKLETLLQDKNYLEYNLSSGILDMIINMKEHSKNKIENYLGKRFIRLQTLKDRISKIQL